MLNSPIRRSRGASFGTGAPMRTGTSHGAGGFDGGTDRERIREASPIETIVGEFGVSLRQEGRNFKALCPFHREKTPSFYVDPERGTFRCFGCSEHGDVFSFVEKMDSLDFRGALRVLAERAGIELTGVRKGASLRPDEKDNDHRLLVRAARWFGEQRQGQEGEAARAYLTDRGFGAETLDAFGVGYAPAGWSHLADTIRAENLDVERGVRLGLLKCSPEGRVYDAMRQRVVFPIRDPRGRVIGFGGRHIDVADSDFSPSAGVEERRSDPPPKYINSPESELFHKGKVLYGHFEGRDTIRSERHLLLMEGYTDVLMAHQAGFPGAVATLGTALAEANVDRITRLADRVTLVFDGDRAGIDAARKAVLLFAPNSIEVRVVILDRGEDPCDLLSRADGAEQFRSRIESGIEGLDFVLERCFVDEDPASAGGRDRAARAFYPYVERLSSEMLRGTALERLASRIGQPFGRIERDFEATRRSSRTRYVGESADAGPGGARASDVLPHEEEGILLAALTGAAEAAVVLRLQRFRDPLLARLAERIALEGHELDPLRIDAADEKAKALELVERHRELGVDEDAAMRLLVELVRRHLRALALEGQTGSSQAGEAQPADTGWIRRITEIRRAGAELGARPPHDPQALVEILDRFGPVRTD